MTHPNTAAKLLLVADRRSPSAGPAGVAVRRYRLARLRLDGRASESGTRFDHIKRVFD